MPEILMLSQETIDKIAAGEVVDRPSSVVKELVENAIDAKATAITVEIKDGGTSLIRITDNGCGIEADQVRTAFLRHSTSKIRKVEDLLVISSLGFRGEALSSISAVSRLELITKTDDQLTGVRFQIEGGKEVGFEEVGAPNGTTFLVKDLFYNTPARKKFLKSNQTEGNYISDFVEKLAMSHPEISFKFISNNQIKLHTSGNNNGKDLIFHIFGREITGSLLDFSYDGEYFSVSGFLAKPSVTRGNRNYENYFINHRYIKSPLISKAVEEAYKNFLMQHQYPFVVLYFDFPSDSVDVNVHPSKMEMRIDHQQEVYKELCNAIYDRLANRNLIPQVPVKEEEEEKPEASLHEDIPEPFENRRLNDLRQQIAKDSPYEPRYSDRSAFSFGSGGVIKKMCPLPRRVSENYSGLDHSFQASLEKTNQEKRQAQEQLPGTTNDNRPVIWPEDHAMAEEDVKKIHSAKLTDEEESLFSGSISETAAASDDSLSSLDQLQSPDKAEEKEPAACEEEKASNPGIENTGYQEMTLASYSPDFMTKDAKKKHRIIGQVFKTYWLIEYEDNLYIIDQHAAHEKVLYERTMTRLANKEYTSQMVSPPMVISLDAKEQETLEKYKPQMEKLGYVIESFGGRDYQISGVPANLYSIDSKELFVEMLDDFSGMTGRETPELILERVATMSCKAAVKGNHELSLQEIDTLIDDLLSLENPYNCPHGRPTIISISKYEMEKKFKRIVS